MSKYRPFPPVNLPDRQWPNKVIDKAPIWCSVDLRDGNQALAQPMNVEEKLEYFDMLLKIGFKEIEVGFPSASQIEFDFIRRLIEEKRIPDDVTIQILCQCRADLIDRSIESLRGAKNVIFHLYNSTSPAQRKYVFNAAKEDIVKIATDAVSHLKKHGQILIDTGTNLRLEYSPESFTSTELEFALEICEAVVDVWQPTVKNKIILNLPTTVEYATPNVHADQIEWMCRNLRHRDRCIVSLHTHNDRGTGVASTELALMAGADRVEGTLFGNGERTGNLDIVIVALNMFTHGVDPKLDFGDLMAIREVYERTTRMDIHARQPYAGELVFTAFSGSHQDAIKKSWSMQTADKPWDVLYIPVDPHDIGRTYEAIIRINSQSGKGGVAFILKEHFGLDLPKAMHPEIGQRVNQVADKSGQELSPEAIWKVFNNEYLINNDFLELVSFRGEAVDSKTGTTQCELVVRIGSKTHKLKGKGTGPLEAFVHGLNSIGFTGFEVQDFHENAVRAGADSQAAAYVRIELSDEVLKAVESNGAKPIREFWGCGLDKSITLAGLKALVSAVNRAHRLVSSFAPAIVESWLDRFRNLI